MTCYGCGGKKAKKVKTPYQTSYDGHPVLVEDVELVRCPDCHESFFDPEQAKALTIKVRNKVRRDQGLLSPEEIVGVRGKLHLTQPELENYLGKGPKTVTRWETGRVVQPKETDIILRMLNHDPQLLEVLKNQSKNRAQRKERAVATASAR